MILVNWKVPPRLLSDLIEPKSETIFFMLGINKSGMSEWAGLAIVAKLSKSTDENSAVLAIPWLFWSKFSRLYLMSFFYTVWTTCLWLLPLRGLFT